METYKKWWFWVIVLIGIAIIIIVKGCDMEILNKYLGNSSIEMGDYRPERSVRDILGLPEDFAELIIYFTGEEGADEGWVLDMDCLMPCEDAWDNCEAACEFGSCNLLWTCHDVCYEIDGACGIMYDCQDDCGVFDFDCRDTCFYDLYDDCHACFTGCDTLYSHDCNSCHQNCDNSADECVEDCWYYATDEIYVWDGSEVTDIGSFYEDNFPMFTMQLRGACTWMDMGIFESSPEVLGCFFPPWLDDFFSDFCGIEALTSAGVVCETVGGIYTCSEEEISCIIEV